MEEFQNIISYTENNPLSSNYYSYTVIQDYHENNIEFNWDLLNEKPLLSNITLDQRLEQKISKGFLNIIFIVVISPILSSFDSISQKLLAQNYNRRDRVIFISPEKYIEILAAQPWFIDLGYKILISMDTWLIWVDPYTWGNGQMDKISQISEKRVNNPRMGGMLRGRHLVGFSFEYPPDYFNSAEGNEGQMVIDGISFRLTQLFAQQYNFTFSAEHSGTSMGQIFENGTRDGFMGNLDNPELGYDYGFHVPLMDFLIGHAEYPSYSAAIHETKIIFVTQHGRLSSPWFAFLLPFQPIVWIYSVTTFLILAILQSMSMYYLQCDRKCTPAVIDSASITPISLILEQGLTNIPHGIRIFSVLVLIAGTVLGTGYRSTLRVNISFPRREYEPQYFEEILNYPDANLYLFGVGVEKELLGPIDLYRQIESRLNFIPQDKMGQVLRDSFQSKSRSFLIDWETLLIFRISKYLTLNENVPPFLFSKDYIYYIQCSVALVKGSKYADSFILLTYAGIENGLNMKNEFDIYRDIIELGRKKYVNPDASEQNQNIYKHLKELQSVNDFERSALTLENLRIVLIIVPLGCVCGIFVFLLEYLSSIKHIKFSLFKPFISV